MRLVAGLAGGLVGGLAFGLIMIGQVIGRVSAFNDLGFLPGLIDSSDGMTVWVVHLGVSAMLGLIYALLVSTRAPRTNALLGIAYGVVVFVAEGIVIVAARGGSLFDFDPAALAGHVVFGLALGLVYPAIWREEIALVGIRAGIQPQP